MLWKLSELDRQNKKNLRDTNWSILLLIISITMLLILWLGQPPTNPSKEVKAENTSFTTHNNIVTKIELERHTHQVKPSQPINFILSATNTTDHPFSGSLSIDQSQIIRYLTPIPNANDLITKNEMVSWLIKDLAPNETIQTTLKFQSLNNFGWLLTDKTDHCNINISFGNQLSLPVECSRIKLAQIKLADLGEDGFYHILVITVLAIILMIKILFRTELKLSIKETRLIRQEINHGRLPL